MYFEPSEIYSSFLPPINCHSSAKNASSRINFESDCHKRRKNDTSSRNLYSNSQRLSPPMYYYTTFICSFLILSSIFPTSVSAFTAQTFEEHAHRKHKMFVEGADEWIFNSESECQHRFEYERWPCDKQDHEDIISGSNSSLLQGTKEAAFVQALTAASIIHTSLKLCFDGTEGVDCDCEDENENRYGTVNTGDETNTFVKCSEHYIKYANRVFGKFRQQWLSGKTEPEDLMILHNSETGRRSLIKRKFEKCSCNGLSGSCSSKTCWEELPQMRHISAVLKSVYNNERNNVKTLMHSGLKKKLLTIDSRMVPSKNALVFIEDSPDYCDYMDKRNCSKIIPPHYDQDNVAEWEVEHRARLLKSCDNLCLECGYDVHEEQVKYLNTECECVFHWCCTVNCSSCEVDQTLHSCKRNLPLTPLFPQSNSK